MKISDSYPVIRNLNAVLIVSGGIGAGVFYEIKHGRLHKCVEITILDKKFTDREGRFEHRGKQGTVLMASGGGYKDNLYRERKRKFLKAIIGAAEKFPKLAEVIYLFAPRRHIKLITESLPLKLRNLLGYTFAGNYTKHHPTVLLDMIKQQRLEVAKPLKRKKSQIKIKNFLKH